MVCKHQINYEGEVSQARMQAPTKDTVYSSRKKLIKTFSLMKTLEKHIKDMKCQGNSTEHPNI